MDRMTLGGFALGLVVGGAIGVFVMSLLNVAGKDEDERGVPESSVDISSEKKEKLEKADKMKKTISDKMQDMNVYEKLSTKYNLVYDGKGNVEEEDDDDVEDLKDAGVTVSDDPEDRIRLVDETEFMEAGATGLYSMEALMWYVNDDIMCLEDDMQVLKPYERDLRVGRVLDGLQKEDWDSLYVCNDNLLVMYEICRIDARFAPEEE